MFDYTGSTTALITGASRGIGAEMARQLAARGASTLILVARTTDDMEALAEEIVARFQTRVEIIMADLSEEDAPARLKEETDRRGLHVDLLVNNAGFGSHGFFDESDLTRETNLMAVNITSLVQLTRLYLPEMVKKKRGGIIQVASTAGFQPVPFMATYGASKAFVLSFSEALWAENRDRGVSVVCLCPGSTDTAFDFGEGKSRGRFETAPQSTPQEVVRAGLDALDQNASFVIVGRANYVGALAARVLPRAAVARVSGAIFRPPSPSAKVGRKKIIAGAALMAAVSAAALVAVRKRR